MKRILQLEQVLLRIETWTLIVLVGVMLLLASYNVAYRNLLVPLQRDWASSGPPVTVEHGTVDSVAQTAADEEGDGVAGEPSEGRTGGQQEGFVGGFAGEVEDGDATDVEAEPSTAGKADGFVGGLGDPPSEGEAPADATGAGAGGRPTDQAAAPDEEGVESFAGGFGGGFGGATGAPDDPALEGGPGMDAPAAVTTPEEPVGGPPPEGSLTAWGIEVIDALKIGWIDIFLRQLVIIVSFLGGMLAAHRGKHINIDAISKLFSPLMQNLVAVLINTLSVAICVTLALAGADLVAIGRDYPKDLLPWAEEWAFQLMFPVGFGLLALHFTIRSLESLLRLLEGRRATTAKAARARRAAGGPP